jgi:hypothetical protein
VRREIGIGVTAELLNGGLQVPPGRYDGLARNALTVFARALFEPSQIARQTEDFALHQIAIETAGDAGTIHALQKFGQLPQPFV